MSSSDSKSEKVAVVGGTGRVGRELVEILVSRGISVRCLIRFDPPSTKTNRLQPNASSYEVAEYFASLDKVKLIKGDLGNVESLKELLQGCAACFALFGASRRSKLSDLFTNAEDTDPTHPKAINYAGVQNIITAAMDCKTCKRIVRITGKGENPWSPVSIIINMFGSMAKGWNYEGEQLLRKNLDIEYTIIRPGILVDELAEDKTGKVLALSDNGQDLKVSAVARSDIATLCVDCVQFPNAARSTLTAMNVDPNQGTETYLPLLTKVKPDTREFPSTLIREHKRAVRCTLAAISAVSVSMTAGFISLVKSLLK